MHHALTSAWPAHHMPGHGATRIRTQGAALLLLAALVILASCGPARTSATPTATPTVAPTATPAPGPTPVTTLLDPPPTNCPSAPPLQILTFTHFGGFSGSVTLHGDPPVWIAGFNYQTVVHADPQGYTPWPETKIIWEVGPNYSQPVSIQAINLQTGELSWWNVDTNAPPTRTLVLDQSNPFYHGTPEPGWNEWGSGLYIPVAGCYALQVTWPGGHWRTIFAAGR
jgi:hypothetical protein